MKKFSFVVLFVVWWALATGCGVSQSDYQKVVSERDTLKEQMGQAQKEVGSLKEEITALQKSNKEVVDQLEKIKAENKRLKAAAQAQGTPRPAEDRTTNDSKAKVYEVKSGDNLLSIAKKTGVSAETIKKLNNLESHHLKVGQKLRLQ